MEYKWSVRRSLPDSRAGTARDSLLGKRWEWTAGHGHATNPVVLPWLQQGVAFTRRGAKRKAMRAIKRQHALMLYWNSDGWPEPETGTIDLGES